MHTYDKILLARDFSQSSRPALRNAVQMARLYQSELHIFFADVLHADPYSFGASMEPARSTDEMRERLKEHTEKTFQDENLDAAGVPVTYAVERDVAPGPAILNYAEEAGIDLIVMGTHGRRGIRRMLLGSVAEEVVRLSPCPVLTVQANSTTEFPFRTILLPIDFSEHSQNTLRQAKEMAGRFDTRLILLHIIEDTLPPSYHTGNVFSDRKVDDRTLQKAREQLANFLVETAGADNVEAQCAVEAGHAADRIIHFASTHDVDVVMMASHGRTGMERFAMGSVADKVIRNVRCPVFTLKAYPEAVSKMRDEEIEDTRT